MRTVLEQPMGRSEFIKVCFAVAGAFILCPRSRREGTPTAEAAEGTVAHGDGAQETVKVYSVEKKGFVTVGKVVRTDAEWRKTLEIEQYAVSREKGTEEPYSGQYVDPRGRGAATVRGAGAVQGFPHTRLVLLHRTCDSQALRGVQVIDLLTISLTRR